LKAETLHVRFHKNGTLSQLDSKLGKVREDRQVDSLPCRFLCEHRTKRQELNDLRIAQYLRPVLFAPQRTWKHCLQSFELNCTSHATTWLRRYVSHQRKETKGVSRGAGALIPWLFWWPTFMVEHQQPSNSSSVSFSSRPTLRTQGAPLSLSRPTVCFQ